MYSDEYEEKMRNAYHGIIYELDCTFMALAFFLIAVSIAVAGFTTGSKDASLLICFFAAQFAAGFFLFLRKKARQWCAENLEEASALQSSATDSRHKSG